jgi:hypothetical protein
VAFGSSRLVPYTAASKLLATDRYEGLKVRLAGYLEEDLVDLGDQEIASVFRGEPDLVALA